MPVIPTAHSEAETDERLRVRVFDALREAEAHASSPAEFRERVRWPIIQALLRTCGTHRVELSNGLIFEVGPDSRIEQALLLSPDRHPDHVWEPQTTKLLVAIGAQATHVIVGGAYIGDQVLPIAKACGSRAQPGVVHAFEPMNKAFGRLLRNLELNALTNVEVHRAALWDCTGASLSLEGDPALACSRAAGDNDNTEQVTSLTIDAYVRARQLESVGLIMLDTEGGEEKALEGARQTLERPYPESPTVVFEVHRNFVDWSKGLENTSIVRLLTSRGYRVFAIRDFQSNVPMANRPVEVVPIDRVYLEGPPHGFNLLASKTPTLIESLGLRVVEYVSPKLLRDKDPALHHPLDGLE
jgi:FkbM family methyltransferase